MKTLRRNEHTTWLTCKIGVTCTVGVVFCIYELQQPPTLHAPLCFLFSSSAAVTALAFKLGSVITRALHFNKSVINVISPSVLSQ